MTGLWPGVVLVVAGLVAIAVGLAQRWRGRRPAIHAATEAAAVRPVDEAAA